MSSRRRCMPALLALLALMSAPDALAKVSFSLSAVGAVSYWGHTLGGTIPGAGITLTNGAELGFGGGLLLEAMFNPKIGLELGGLLLQRKWERHRVVTSPASDQTTTFSGNSIHVPLLLRFKLGSKFSIGVGAYMSQLIGDANAVTTGTSSSTTTGSWAGTDYTTMDYGVLASLRLRIPLSAKVGLIADGRFGFGFAEGFTDTFKSGGTATLQHSDIQGLIGLQFGGGGK